MAGIVAAALTLYLTLLCPEPYWGDSASLSSRLETDPKPFARSYWLYKRTALAISLLGPSPALAANLASALFGALGVGGVAAIVSRLGGGAWGAVVGASTLGLAHTWWTMSEVAEVYTLHGLLLVLLVLLSLDAERPRQALLLGIVAGLALNHHRMILAPIALVGGFALHRAPRQRRRIALGFALGALPWLLLCVRHPPGSLTPPEGVTALELWLQRALLGGRASAGEFLPPGQGLLAGWARLARHGALNLPGPALLLAVVGLRGLWRRDRSVAGLLVVLSTAAVLVANALRWAGDAHVYLIGLYPLLAVLAGVGAAAVLRVRRGLALGTGALAILGPPALYALLAWTPLGAELLPAMSAAARVEQAWPGRRGWDAGPRFWARLDADLEPGGVVFPRWREGTVLEYRQRVDGARPDLQIELHPQRPVILGDPRRPTYVTWTPPSAEVPLDVAGLDLFLQGDVPGFRRVVVREW